MPIRPENKHRYPADWKAIRQRILERARHRCEQCGVPNYAWGWRDASGAFQRVSKAPILDTYSRDERRSVKPPLTLQSDQGPLRIIEIVLTIAHLDHVPEHCESENLRALCQRCHLAYDAEHHAQTAYASRRAGRAAADLFDLDREAISYG